MQNGSKGKKPLHLTLFEYMESVVEQHGEYCFPLAMELHFEDVWAMFDNSIYEVEEMPERKVRIKKR